jgi:hypothetical protein
VFTIGLMRQQLNILAIWVKRIQQSGVCSAMTSNARIGSRSI